MASAPKKKQTLSDLAVGRVADAVVAAWEEQRPSDAHCDELGGTWTFEIVRDDNMRMVLRRSIKVAGGYVNTMGLIRQPEFGVEDPRPMILSRVLALADPPSFTVEDEPWD